MQPKAGQSNSQKTEYASQWVGNMLYSRHYNSVYETKFYWPKQLPPRHAKMASKCKQPSKRTVAFSWSLLEATSPIRVPILAIPVCNVTYVINSKRKHMLTQPASKMCGTCKPQTPVAAKPLTRM